MRTPTRVIKALLVCLFFLVATPTETAASGLARLGPELAARMMDGGAPVENLGVESVPEAVALPAFLAGTHSTAPFLLGAGQTSCASGGGGGLFGGFLRAIGGFFAKLFRGLLQFVATLFGGDGTNGTTNLWDTPPTNAPPTGITSTIPPEISSPPVDDPGTTNGANPIPDPGTETLVGSDPVTDSSAPPSTPTSSTPNPPTSNPPTAVPPSTNTPPVVPPPATTPVGVPPAEPAPTGAWSDRLAFVPFPAQKNASDRGWGAVLTDIENHLPASYGTQYRDADKITHGHETTHGINSHLRNHFNKTGRKANGFYVGDGRGVIIEEPGIRKSAVAKHVPPSLRGSRYGMYVTGAADWDDTPTYLLDEWVAYTNGSLVGVDQVKRGLWNAGWRDGVAGTLEFTVYGFALAMAVAEKDPAYWRNNAQFKAFIAFQAERSMRVFREGAPMTPFRWDKQEAAYRNFVSAADAAPMRAFIVQTWGQTFWDEVILGQPSRRS